MNKILILISFMTISVFGYCDTLDYYHVYLNDSLIEQYNSLSEKPSIELKSSELNDNDVITVRYGTDHPCFECVYVLNVLIEVKEKTPEVETTENYGKLSIPIKDLIYFRNKYEIDKYHFNYSVRTKKKMNGKGTHLFELKFI
ncbi:hypothetical protein KFE94_02870 [bacterium SCSIO 12643]|nr:hypothetical protein KFE94_02870 [bacterium SCSIO 12643]